MYNRSFVQLLASLICTKVMSNLDSPSFPALHGGLCNQSVTSIPGRMLSPIYAALAPQSLGLCYPLFQPLHALLTNYILTYVLWKILRGGLTKDLILEPSLARMLCCFVAFDRRRHAFLLLFIGNPCVLCTHCSAAACGQFFWFDPLSTNERAACVRT